MKTTITEPEDHFRPRSITFTFESQKELDAFGAVFNFRPVNDFLEECGVNPQFNRLYEKFSMLGAALNTDRLTVIARKP
jgi:hypothetical protein